MRLHPQQLVAMQSRLDFQIRACKQDYALAAMINVSRFSLDTSRAMDVALIF